MSSLDTLLERLDKLDEKRTQIGKLWIDELSGQWDTPRIYAGPGAKMLHFTHYGKMREDAAFIVEAVNTNATLREVIRVQSVALKSMAISDSYAVTPDGVHDVASNLHWNQMTARAALQRVEEIVKCGM